MAPLIVCPSCACLAKTIETHCPHCGAQLKGASLGRTAAAILLGLATSGVACGDSSGSGGAGGVNEGGEAAFYGVAGSPGNGGMVVDGGGGAGGAGDGGMAAFYGVAGSPSTGGGGSGDGGMAAFYGIAGSPGTGGNGGNNQ